MSGIFGIFNQNGKPVDKNVVKAMLDTMSYWEPDDQGTWIKDSVAFGHIMLWNTPESKFEHLPNKQDHLVITMDARLDNREELAKQLEISEQSLEQVADSDFILAAYDKWGKDCPKYLLGDFAFAIWDQKKEQLFCARDHIGIKQLYYYQQDDLFIFANEMRCFLKHPQIKTSLDDNSIARYLRGEEWCHHNTFYTNVCKLPPAVALVITSDTMTLEKYWLPENSSTEQLDSVEAYADKLRELLEQAVKVRLRSLYPITSHLSGGLDSSAIAAIASRFLRKEKKQLLSFNWISDPEQQQTNPEYYEWGYSKLLADREKIEHHYIDIDEGKLTDIFLNFDILSNDTADLWYEFLLRDVAKKKQSRVVLSGWGGDELVSSYGTGYFAELFLRGRFIKAIVKLREYLQSTHKKHSWIGFTRLCFRVFIRQPFASKVRIFFRRSKRCVPLPICCIKDQFSEYLNRLTPPDDHFSKTSVRNVQLASLQKGHLQHRIESWSVSAMKDKIEYRYPLLDKRLVEFVLNIPSELFIAGNSERFIFREAMKGILPETIRLNTLKDEPERVLRYHELTVKALCSAIDGLPGKRNDYIDGQLLRQRIKEVDLAAYESRNDKIWLLESLTRALFVANIETYKGFS